MKSGILKGIVGLPPNLFYGTGIPACILVLDKENATARTGVFMIDASREFLKDGNKNRLREQDIHRIVDTFHKVQDVSRYARMVPYSEIADAKNDFNLNLPRYIDTSEPEDRHDISAHLRGGIPERDVDALSMYWSVMPSVQASLFMRGDRDGYMQLTMPLSDVKRAILDNEEFRTLDAQVSERFIEWRSFSNSTLDRYGVHSHPKALVAALSEQLLQTFNAVPLLNAYAVYQQLMDYWAATMQDDAYAIAADGWVATPVRVVETNKKGQLRDKGWVCDLVPKSLIVARYLAAQQAALDALQAELDAATGALAELEEEHGGEDAALGGLEKLATREVNRRLDELVDDADAADESGVLQQWLELSEQQSTLRRMVREQDAALDKMAFEKYATLVEADVRSLVVDDKWMTNLWSLTEGELDQVSQLLTRRVRELAQRYAEPLPSLMREVDTFNARVEAHLARMGTS